MGEMLTEQNYYSVAMNQKYCSASQFRDFCGTPFLHACEERALKTLNGEWKPETTKALLMGSLLDALWENDDPEYLIERFPDCVSTRGATKGQLKSEFQQVINIYQMTLKSERFCAYMSGKKQVIQTGVIEGLPFKIKIDSFHEDKAIVDLKTTQTLDRNHRYYVPDSGERLPFYLYQNYDVQLAIYREVVRQNSGYTLPCYLAVADKMTHPICDVIQLPPKMLDEALDRVKRNAEHIIQLKNGEIEPIRCESSDCHYCRDTHVCQVISTDEFEANDIPKGAV